MFKVFEVRLTIIYLTDERIVIKLKKSYFKRWKSLLPLHQHFLSIDLKISVVY